MIIYYTPSTGAILSAISAAKDPGTYPKNLGTPLYLDDATYTDVWDHPGWYLIQSDLPVAQPAWSVTALESTTTPGEYTDTATLHNVPTTPPSEATFTVAGHTFTEAITSNQATLTLAVHPLLGGQRVVLQVTATGTVAGSTVIGTTPALIGQGMQTIQTVPTVVPAGPGSLNYVLEATANTVPLGETMNALALGLAEVLHFVHNDLIPWMQSTSYTPWKPTDPQGFALANIQSALLPNIPFTLGNIVPASDAPIPVWQQLLTTLTAFQTASTTANEALSTLTDLS